MYNLAIYNGYDYDIPSSIRLREFHFSQEQQLLSQLDTVQGVVIHYSEEDNQNKILELILSINRHFSLPIWIRDKAESTMSKKLNLELGVLGNLDSTISDEEMYVIIENTLNLFHRKATEEGRRDPINKIKLDSFNNSIKLAGTAEVALTQLEYRMLTLLATRVNQAFTYEEIYESVWSFGEDVSIQVKKYRTSNLAFHIRNKLSRHGINPKVLRTVRSVGYLLDSNIKENTLRSEKEVTLMNRRDS